MEMAGTLALFFPHYVGGAPSQEYKFQLRAAFQLAWICLVQLALIWHLILGSSPLNRTMVATKSMYNPLTS